MLRKSISRVLVLAAFLLLPLVVQASPVAFSGVGNFSSGVGGTGGITISNDGFAALSDTTAVTTYQLGSVVISGEGPWNQSVNFGVIFFDPSALNLGTPFQFTLIGDAAAGVVLSVTQTGAQDITLDGVNYHITFALSQLSLLPGQTANVSMTLTPSSVPEPATMLLLGSGLAGIAAKVRKRRKTV